MPGMSGLDFLSKIRSDYRYNSSVVFVVSSLASKTEIEEIHSFNVAGYFIKPTDPEDFYKFANMVNDYTNLVILPE